MADVDRLQTLAIQSAAGGKGAFEELARELHGGLFAYLHLMKIPPAEADDVAQEIMIAVFHSLSSYQPAQPFLPWFRGIMAHRVADYWRNHAREQERKAGFQRYVESRTNGADESGLGLDEIARLKDCLERLQPRQREIVTLRYFDNAAAPRIAEKLETSPAAVRQALARAREGLRECVKGSA